MSFVRLILVGFRVLLALGWTLGVHYFCIAIPGLFIRKKRFLHALQWWGKGLSVIMGIRVHRVNAPPEGMGDVIVSNHMGFLDIPVLLQFFPAVFVIKMELGKVPFFGARLVAQGHVFVERSSRTSRSNARQGIERVLHDGDRIIVFPEGKASPDAERPPWAPATFQVAQRLGKKVQLCIIDYLPNRALLKWDISKPTLPQLANLLGRRRIDVSIQFIDAEDVIGDPVQQASAYKTAVETQLLRNQPR
jgi:1-acyl-sn-glycerol-3-phosphate acyltransferase